MQTMKKRLIFTALGLLVVVSLLVGIKAAQITTLIENGKSFRPPPISISSFDVTQDQWQNTLHAIGSLEAGKGLLITADLPGRIAKIHFDAGSEVKAGALLVEQDISSEKTQLRSAKAAASLAEIQLDRVEELYRKKVASKSEFDSAGADFDAAVANVDNILADIEKKSIRAPFDGKLGIRLVNLGQIINAGDPVVSLQATNQMLVNFSLPQQHLSRLADKLPVSIVTDAIPDKQFSGFISTIDPEINSTTRSIKLQATIENPSEDLLPGMFVTLKVILPQKLDVTLVPITAVQYATFGDSVFVIEEKSESDEQPGNADNGINEKNPSENNPSEKKPNERNLVARQQFVKLGQTRGDYVVVEKGLSVGQQVVSAGVFKLRNGAPVVINNSVAPTYSLEPTVIDQ